MHPVSVAPTMCASRATRGIPSLGPSAGERGPARARPCLPPPRAGGGARREGDRLHTARAIEPAPQPESAAQAQRARTARMDVPCTAGGCAASLRTRPSSRRLWRERRAAGPARGAPPQEHSGRHYCCQLHQPQQENVMVTTAEEKKRGGVLHQSANV